MQTWKKAVVFGSLGAGTVLAVSGRRPAGFALVAAGLALLASEYPEKFEAVWENAPECVSRASQVLATLSKLSERRVEQAERRSIQLLRPLTDE